jgi:diguanylate cyclase (GGDEF)-like protein
VQKRKKLPIIIIYSPVICVIIMMFIASFFLHTHIEQLYLLGAGTLILLILFKTTRGIYKEIEIYIQEIQKNEEELKEKNKTLQDMLYIDMLTKLPTRKSLKKDLETMEFPKIVLLDVDSFKDINEYYGAAAGDFILLDIAKDLQEFIQDTKMQLYRIGADEFVLLEDESLDIEKYEDIAEELVSCFKSKEVFVPEIDQVIEVNVTIGISLESENVLSKAFTALNHAKKTQKDFVCYMKNFDTKDLYAKQVTWSNFIKESIAKDQVYPYFQPIFDTEGKVNKYECLVRIVNDHEEAISPGFFLETSKNVRQYSKIVKVLIEKAFKLISQTNKSVSINLLARDMSDSDVSNYVVDKIKEYDLAKQVVLEILEDENIESLERVDGFLHRVRRMGVRIAIDDFGTGYSNFSYLLKLRPDYIKIDGSLIKKIDTDENSLAIVSAIIVFAKKLGIKTIAEFVHTQEVHKKCKELGIDEFQGFYLGEPSSSLYEN